MTDDQFLKPLSKEVIYFSSDTRDIRLGNIFFPQNADFKKLKKYLIQLIGYPDDEGIQLNGGRKGSALAPDSIRKYFYRLTPPFEKKIDEIHLIDKGNLVLEGLSLEQRHERAQTLAKKALDKNKKCLSFGGGHDYGYADGSGFLEAFCGRPHLNLKPLIINFDAHLDVRPLQRGLTSGTPFYRLLEKYEDQFDLIEIGPQYHCNSPHHIAWCKEKNVQILFWEEIRSLEDSPLSTIKKKFSRHFTPQRPTYISIDIDGFSSSYAMGCSQSWPTGFSPDQFLPVLDFLLATLDVQSLGIYEVSPPLDQDGRTAKLAALIAYQFVFSHTNE